MSQADWQALSESLAELERLMRELALWSEQAPQPQRMNSRAPFFVDTLAFEEWLQWVFIPRMRVIAEQRAGLPPGCNVTPMGEEAFIHLAGRQQALLTVLARIDRLATRLAD
ncbi:YqcC family protein [Halopseudomonas phragmitis]|uniref:YqcC-like domain-containing protein n=1 Tax=Halopseudomonas phragmitis TaxID=1931241 RepID=A0A1V0B0Y3_9GAMM|nr:YqcC family protein [Halopseudomonas phragmitis]AQZ93565.1 hypothetical protein BVH74_01765 [Halopseudomonas phragmitis]